MRIPHPWRGLAGLPRDLWVLCAATLVNRAGTMALPFLALYLTEARGWPAGRAGLVLTTYGIGSLVAAPAGGWFADRFGVMRVMRASLVGTAVLLLVFVQVTTVAGIFALAFAWSLASECFRPAAMAAVTHWTPPERQRAAFALNRLAINLGMSVGPAAGGFLAALSFPALFRVDAATGAAAALVLWPARSPAHAGDGTAPVNSATAPAEPAHAVAPTAPHASAARDRAPFRNPRLLVFLVTLVPVLVVFFQHTSTMALFMVRDLHLSEATYGLLFTLNTAIIILLEVPLNLAMQRWSHARALPLGALLAAAGFGGLGLVRGAWGAAATVVVWTFGEMILFPGASAYVAEIAPAKRRGAYMGAYTMSFGLAFVIAPWLGTHVLERWGGGALWATMAALGSLSVIFLPFAARGATPAAAPAAAPAA